MAELNKLLDAARSSEEEVTQLLQAIRVVMNRIESVVVEFSRGHETQNASALGCLAADVGQKYSVVVQLGRIAIELTEHWRPLLKKSLQLIEVSHVGHPRLGLLNETCNRTLKSFQESEQVVALLSTYAAYDVDALRSSARRDELSAGARIVVTELINRVNRRKSQEL